jgi:Zn-dependent membrane protease YugP
VLHQIVEQLELGGTDLEQIALPAHAVGRGIQHQLANADLVLHLLRRTAAQHGTNAGQQLLVEKGLVM